MLIGASAIAASALVAIVVPVRRAAARVYETSLGETRLVPLEDGSTVTLNTDSKIAVTIDGAERRVQLDRGEALFKLATADRAPFTVEAGDTRLRARDATFAVCRLDDQPLLVTVCEGDIEVTRDAGAAPGPRRLHANMKAVMRADGTMIERAVTAQGVQRELAWQEGMLSFEDTPLRQAADTFARYSSRRIAITDPMVGAETVTGLYAANNPEGFARAAALSLNLQVQSTAGGIILSR
jgi:transmembrane sensor